MCLSEFLVENCFAFSNLKQSKGLRFCFLKKFWKGSFFIMMSMLKYCEILCCIELHFLLWQPCFGKIKAKLKAFRTMYKGEWVALVSIQTYCTFCFQPYIVSSIYRIDVSILRKTFMIFSGVNLDLERAEARFLYQSMKIEVVQAVFRYQWSRLKGNLFDRFFLVWLQEKVLVKYYCARLDSIWHGLCICS